MLKQNKNKFFLLFFILIFSANQLSAQTISPDLQAKDKWTVHNRSAELINEQGMKGIHLSQVSGDGMMFLKDFEFSNGTIELDIRGKNVPQQSFVGIAFHAQDTGRFDAIYFRPFNFSNPDTMRRSRAVQYISTPKYGWEYLRETFPGKYEDKVNPVPDPDGWFHVKVTVSGKLVKVYVDGAHKPSLEVERLSTTSKGQIGLWVGHNSSGDFANLKVTSESDIVKASSNK